MNNKFFADCQTINEVKQLYRKLAFIHHPDKGGDAEIFKALSNEYEATIKYFAIHGDKKPGTGPRRPNQTAEDINNILFEDEQYKKAIDALINCDGLIIEIVGLWIWVTGETRPHKETLKNAGYFWASKKSAWYFRTEANKVNNRKKYSLDEIRDKYGSTELKNKRSYLAA